LSWSLQVAPFQSNYNDAFTELNTNILRRYVSAIHLPTFSPDILISGGGDPYLKIWNWISGECIGQVQIWDFVEPFIVVKNIKGKRMGDEERGEGSVAKKRKGKGKKSRRRGKKHSGKVEAESVAEVPSHEEGGQDEDDANEQEEESSMTISEEKVLVVNKIASSQSRGNNFLLFSAVGSVLLLIHYSPTRELTAFHQSNCFILFPASYGIHPKFRLWSPYHRFYN
jgi:tRNA (guanine-N(7)-)-methyltransferase subunit TRM82